MATDNKKRSLWKRLVRYFVAGAFMMLPLVLTVVAISWGIGFLSGLVGPDTFLGELLSKGWNAVRNQSDRRVRSRLGRICRLGFCRRLSGRVGNARLYQSGDRCCPAPCAFGWQGLRNVSTICHMLDTSGDDKLKGMSAAYCSFGDQGGVGVLALLPKQEIININGADYYVCTGSAVACADRRWFAVHAVGSVQKVDMSVDTLMSIYVSMGVVAPSSLLNSEEEHEKP